MTKLRASQPSNRGSIPGSVREIFFSKTSIPTVGAKQPRILLVAGLRLGREADH